MLALTYIQICWLKLLGFFIVIMALLYIGGCICDYRKRKQEQQEIREYRHLYDLDKQQETDDMEKLYNEIILNEIYK